MPFFACLAAAGAVALAAWAEDGDHGLLALAAIFLAAAALTKNEGLLFALAAAVVAALLQGRSQLPLAAVAGFVVVAVAPWRLFVHPYRLCSDDFDLATSPATATSPTTPAASARRRRALDAVDRPALWGYLLFAFLTATACALLTGRVAAAAFALVWFALSFGARRGLLDPDAPAR